MPLVVSGLEAVDQIPQFLLRGRVVLLLVNERLRAQGLDFLVLSVTAAERRFLRRGRLHRVEPSVNRCAGFLVIRPIADELYPRDYAVDRVGDTNERLREFLAPRLESAALRHFRNLAVGVFQLRRIGHDGNRQDLVKDFALHHF